jgi:2'-hydroxyisoflavone reductase
LDGRSLPLWSGGDPARLILAADPSAAMATGLTPRPLENTIRDTLEWARVNEQPADAGLSADREAEILAAWRRHNKPRQQPPPR